MTLSLIRSLVAFPLARFSTGSFPLALHESRLAVQATIVFTHCDGDNSNFDSNGDNFLVLSENELAHS